MKKITDISGRELIESLRSDLCPSCGGHKKSARTMCFRCWTKLPKQHRQPLYQRIGEGYEQAFASAMNALGVTELHLPGRKIQIPATAGGVNDVSAN